MFGSTRTAATSQNGLYAAYGGGGLKSVSNSGSPNTAGSALKSIGDLTTAARLTPTGLENVTLYGRRG